MTHGDVDMRIWCSRAVLVLAIIVGASCGAKQLSFFGPDAGSGGPGGVVTPGGGAGLPGSPDGGLGGDPNAFIPCDLTTTQALTILETYCSLCHGVDPSVQLGLPAFNALDINSLKTLVSRDFDPVTGRPFALLVPGQPDRSLIYVRVAQGVDPKQPTDIREPRLPVPTVSDLSVLHAWISSCMGDCTDGVDQTCNDDPAVSSLWGTCQAGGCSCYTGFELNPSTRRCRVPIPDAAAGGGGGGGGSTCGATANVDGGLSSSLWPTDDACAGDQLPIVGTWVGYVENMTFPSGSDALRMTVRAASATRLCGSVMLGSGMPPPPVTDSNVGYPPGLFRCAADASPTSVARDVVHLDSFPMTMLGGLITGPRLQFQATVDELWKPWCELQTPSEAPMGVYSCMPSAGACFGQSVDCGKRVLCDPTIGPASPCRCTAEGCTGDPSANTAGHLAFDLRINGSSADGSVNLGEAGLHNLHMDRAP